MNSEKPNPPLLPTLKKLLLLLAVVLLFSCEREDKFTHPVVHTGEVREITGEGARFSGRIVNEGGVDIVDHGFVWGEEREPTVDNSNYSLGMLQNEQFSAKVYYFFQKERVYFLRAFAKDNQSRIIYGREISFRGIVDASEIPGPEISNFYPTSGHWGDTIIVEGKFFSFNTNETLIFLKYFCEVIHATDTLLKFIVPHKLDTISERVILIVNGKSTQSAEDFNIKPPELFSISPETGIYQSSVEIHGEGFHQDFTKLFFGNKEMIIDSLSGTLLTTTIPLELTPGDQDVWVEVLERKGVLSDGFYFKSPVITSFYNSSGTWGDTVTILGQDLVLPEHDTKVEIGTWTSKVILSTRDSIRVIVPSELRVPLSKIKVTANQQTFTSSTFFHLKAPVIHSFTPTSGFFNSEFTVVGEYFHPESEQNQMFFEDIPATIINSNRNQISTRVPNDLDRINSKIKVIAGNQTAITENEFQLEIHTIENLSITSGSRLDQLTIFGTGFTTNLSLTGVTLGETPAMINLIDNNFIRISIPSNSNHGFNPVSVKILDRSVFSPELFFLYEPFTKKSDIPYGGAAPPVKFNISNRIFVGGGKGNNGSNDFWEYNPLTDTWTERANLPMTAKSNATSFVIDNKGFVLINKNLYQYNAEANSWHVKNSFPGLSSEDRTVFTLNNIAYIGGGTYYDHENNNEFIASRELWSYNLQTNAWNQLKDHPLTSANPSDGLINALGFALYGKGYMGLSQSAIIWEYDPYLNQWSEKINLWGIIDNPNRMGMSALVFDESGSKVYISGGKSYTSADTYRDMYLYDVIDNTIIAVPPLPRFSRGFHFSIPYMEKAFIGGGHVGQNYYNKEMHLFEPAKLPPLDN